MRKAAVSTLIALVILIGVVIALRSPPNSTSRVSSEMTAADAVHIRPDSSIGVSSGNKQPSVPLHQGDSSKSAYKDRLALLGECANADAILKAARTSRSAQCIGTTNVQKCIDEHNRATDTDPQFALYRSQLTQCAGIAHPQNEIYLTLRAAAESGDTDAQICFIKGVFSDVDNRDIVGIADVYADYQALTKRYLDAAFSRGDWRIILQFSKERTDLSDAALGAVYPYGTPEIAHKMLRLLELGATGEYATKLEERLQNLESAKDFSGNPILSASQTKEGNEWARTTFDTYYAHSPRLTKEPAAPCDWNAD